METKIMRSSIDITYQWECEDDIEIPQKHCEALQEDAQDRILSMLKEGCTSGELCTTVRLGKEIVVEEDKEEGLNYTGWWSI